VVKYGFISIAIVQICLVCLLVTELAQAKYSCFKKGCPTKPYATIPKGIMGTGGSWSLVGVLGVSAT